MIPCLCETLCWWCYRI